MHNEYINKNLWKNSNNTKQYIIWIGVICNIIKQWNLRFILKHINKYKYKWLKKNTLNFRRQRL